ncbi:MAG UNVERIFIED_CONTAM: hypothetical protein LVR29_18325 [Microcystis novacekii LVE1205-3]|jgi:hypothetical protein
MKIILALTASSSLVLKENILGLKDWGLVLTAISTAKIKVRPTLQKENSLPHD